MTLEVLWAGWRSEYVGMAPPGAVEAGAEHAAQPDTGAVPDVPHACVFCRIASDGPASPDNGILWTGDAVFAVLNAYPYASGHLMVLPVRHVGALDELTDTESTELWSALRAGAAAIEKAYRPEGINLGANLGRAAGAGIPRHLHLHAVPRWVGDTNFMTSVAGARVMPESLPVTWDRLRRAWPR